MLWVGQASESFEPPYFERSNLPFPPLDLRLVRQTLCNSCAFRCFSTSSCWIPRPVPVVQSRHVVGCFGWQALVSAQLLVYGQNEDPGPDLADLYWKTYAAKNHSQEQPSNSG